jgi:hypothetical protein
MTRHALDRVARCEAMPPGSLENREGSGEVAGATACRQDWLVRVGDHLVGWFSDPDARTWERCMVVATPRKVRVVRGATAER